ncbi:hypothetical protein [Qipengyuania nanhaisediminis]|uniref:hypothetical protein n=1 Tax=Qipengyuania nanhaisediminis TaxID=604088 RepID=UPI0038B2B16F
MTFIGRKAALLLTAFGALWTTPAQARDFEVSHAMVPYVYRYAACVFNAGLGETEARIAQCQRLRTQIMAHSQPVFALWHRGEQPRRARQFTRILDQLESEARIADQERKTVPEPIISYFKCMSGPTINSEDFVSGVVICFTELNRVCNGAIGLTGTEVENCRAERLMQRLRLSGNEHYSAGGVPRGITYRRGFLGLHRLPSDDE